MLVVVGPSSGGIRAHVRALTDELRGQGWKVTIAGPRGVIADLDIELEMSRRPRAMLAAIRSIRRGARHADVIHAHGFTAVSVAALVRPRPPLVVTVHNIADDSLAPRGLRWRRVAERFIAGRADAVIPTSGEVARRLRLDGSSVIEPFGPTLAVTRTRDEVRADLGVSESSPLVVAVGRLHRQKGFDVLIDAAGRLSTRRPAPRVVIAGDGPERRALERAVADADLGSTIEFIGALDDVANLVAAADVLAISSRWESGPLILTEAAALGRPIVTTPVGFATSLIHDGRTGRVVPIDDANALAEAIAEFLDDPLGAQAMGWAAELEARQRPGVSELTGRVVATYRTAMDRVR